MLSSGRALLSGNLKPGRWLTSGVVGLRPGLVHHEVRSYPMAGNDVRGVKAAPPPTTRCLVATRGLARGERVCTIGLQNILTGERATDVLHQLCRATASSAQALPASGALVSAIQQCPGSPPLLVTRDSLLIMLALYALRTRAPHDVPSHLVPLWEWVACMPPRHPPLGTLAVEHFEGANSFQPLPRQLRLGSLSQPVLPGEDARATATDLMVRAVEEGGLEALREPQLEAVLTEEMRTCLYEGRRAPLTPRQFEEAAARTLRQRDSLTAQRLLSLNAQLEQTMLRPLTELLTAAATTAGDTGSSDDGGEWRQSPEAEQLRWAHFMMRSRAVNLRGGQSARGGGPLTVQIAVVPFLDMLNHAYENPNISYHLNEDEEQVIVTARRRIAPGEELTLHYGSGPQRRCLFGDVQTPPPAHTAAQSFRSNVRSLEKRQRYEFIDEDEAESAALPVSLPVTSSPATSEADKAAEEATREVDWLWRFGFFRSKQEKAYEASHRWSSGLRRRVADLTDVRRKGRPGEFVIGVPEGLEHLREQREQLERERYHNTRVFPPQRS